MLEIVSASHYSFSSGGREDIDVWMLGNGRPFVVELHNPWKSLTGILNLQLFYDAV